MIEGVKTIPLRLIKDDRGIVMHMMRSDSPWFKQFGEVYFSLVYSNIVKAWKRHKRMTQNFAVPEGEIKLVLYDDREASPTFGMIQELRLSLENYCLVQIPPMVWYGFQCVNPSHALIVNCPDMPHDPAESEMVAFSGSAIPYQWESNKYDRGP